MPFLSKPAGLLAAALAGLASASTANAALVSYYNFNSLPDISTTGLPETTGTTTIAPDQGSGSLSLAGFLGNVDDFSGDTTNALGSDPAGKSLSLLGGTGVTVGDATVYAGNGGNLTFSFSTTGLMDPILTFATRRTNTGFNNNQVQYSTDGVNFTNFGTTYAPDTSFGLQTFDLTAIDSLDNAATAYLRIVLDGATSGSGNNRIDNVQINATPSNPVPEPASLAALAGVAVVGLRRRRRD